ncbi:MAG: M15 family metallopeptidase [Clostridia bacterium]|nr:M15 family metallopeptidase [Clostridia bacterium]
MSEFLYLGKIAILCIAMSLGLTGCGEENIPPEPNEIHDVRDSIKGIEQGEEAPDKEETEKEAPDKDDAINVSQLRRGTKSEIPQEIREQMKGISMPEGATVTFEDLSYLTIPHYDYEGNVAEGHMVVDATLADEVLDIFAELYQIKFPIERMELIDNFNQYIDDTFNTLDRASMSRNNTSSFCYRVVAGTSRMSYHAYGRAIDINPKINPYCVLSTGYVSPSNAYEYADREKDFPGMVRHGDAVYNIFISHGWEWGGDWDDIKDYQHFEKK